MTSPAKLALFFASVFVAVWSQREAQPVSVRTSIFPACCRLVFDAHHVPAALQNVVPNARTCAAVDCQRISSLNEC
ncbi:hypothetical protein BDQ17DRAFT_451958 [Cyathus striatus]|nr:hypothetical protein BDQ17DRAFT_451958 [Cyathus striatus]